MNEMGKAVYVFARCVRALIKIEGMKAENKMVEIRQESPAYYEDDFLRVIDQEGIHENDVISGLRD